MKNKVRIFETVNGEILSLFNSYGAKLRIGTVCSQGIIRDFKQDAFSAVTLSEGDIYANLEPTHTDGRPIYCTKFHVDALRVFDKNYSTKRRKILLLLKN